MKISSLLFSYRFQGEFNLKQPNFDAWLSTEGYFVNDIYRHDCTGHPVLLNYFIHGFIVIYENQNLKKRAVASTDVIRMINERNVRNNNT